MTTLSKMTAEDLQQIVLMVKSRSAFGQYFNLEPKELLAVWSGNKLQIPTEWVMGLSREEFVQIMLEEGSYHKAAERLGVSASTLIKMYRLSKAKNEWPFIVAALQKYQSVRLTAWRLRIKESDVRKAVQESGRKMADLVTYTGSSHNNAKGRRAELFYAEVQGDKIKADKNDEEGSKAPYDFDDVTWGRVNVKSGVRQRLRAKTRGSAPYFWKFSSSGKDECDYFACVGYDEKHQNPLIVAMVPKGWLMDKHLNSFYLHKRIDGTLLFGSTALPDHYILYRWS